MASIAGKRIQKELAELMKSDEAAQNQLEIKPCNDDMMHLCGLIKGPPDTPYTGAEFNLDIIIPENYPFVPPKVKFITKIWHPNISSATGVICLDVLKDQWAAAMSLRTILLSIQALLASPEPDDPQDAVVANQYKSSIDAFNRTARHWAGIYANGPGCDPHCVDLVDKLVQMGFDEAAQNQLEIKPCNDDMMHLCGLIKGPPDTPYTGAEFNLDIIIPENYPFVPPKVKFITKIWHPNISSATGVICLDVLKDQWAAAMSLRTILLSIQALLASPEPDDPQDAVVANQYKSSIDAFNRTARHWAGIYANGPGCDPHCVDLVDKLVQMGFDEHEACRALSMKNWDLAMATEHLIK